MDAAILGAIIGGTAAMGGAGVSAGALWLMELWKRPELHIDYADIKEKNRDEADYTDREGKSHSYLFIGPRITCTGRYAAQNCRVYLTAIEEIHPDKPSDTVLCDAKIVVWAGYNFSPRAVPQGVDFYVDLVRFNRLKDDGWYFQLKPHLFERQKNKGTYRFHLIVTGDNALPGSCKIRVEYTGDPNRIFCKQDG